MIILLIILLGILLTVAGFFLYAYALHLATKIFKVENAKYKTSITIYLKTILFAILFGGITVLTLDVAGLEALEDVALLIIGFLIVHKLLSKHYQTKIKKNAGIYLIFLVFSTLIYFLSAILIVVPVRSMVMEPFYVKGAAMEPNFNNKDYLFFKKFNNDYQRGDVIIFKNPNNQDEYFIKRIIGLPGEKIQLKDGEVILYNSNNPKGNKLQEDYIAPDIKTYGLSDEAVVLGDNEYYVLGDNRTKSKDSRSFGPVEKGLFVGEFWLAPLKKWNLNNFAKQN